MTVQILSRTTAEWTTLNPILADGEPGYEENTYKLKIGDGSTHWVDLPYAWIAKYIEPDYQSILTEPQTIAYNSDGTVASVTIAGSTTTYTYNTDGTVATEERNGQTRTYTYVSGRLTEVV